VREQGSDPAHPAAPDDAAIERALEEHKGNVTRTAQALGMHRNQLRRWLARRGSAGAVRQVPGTVEPTDGEPEGD
jgi:DNA-binding NtrC family response regulator